MTAEEHPIAMYDIHGDRPRDHLLNPAELLSYFGIGGLRQGIAPFCERRRIL